jgi:hypothetical protein
METAKVLVDFVIKSVGKRHFLKAVEEILPAAKSTKVERKKNPVSNEVQCVARVKGARTGLKVGRHVLFESARCEKEEKDKETHLCAVHRNQVTKFGQTLWGLCTVPLTDEQRKVFVDA